MTWSISPAATSSYRTRPGRIGSPAASPDVQPERTHRVRVEVPRGARPGCPRCAAALRIRAVELPETAGVAVDDQDVTVAGGARASFDRSIRRDRVRAGIALVVVRERHGHSRLGAGHRRVRDADRAAVPHAGAEVGLEPGRRADARDPGRRLRVDGQPGHVGVPEGVGRSHRATRRARNRRPWALETASETISSNATLAMRNGPGTVGT